MSPGIWQILIVVALALLLFGGRGKISAIMGDLARGITSFRKGLKDEEGDAEKSADAPKRVAHDTAKTVEGVVERSAEKDRN
jgi:sec-independent protein translocase protein TatA